MAKTAYPTEIEFHAYLSDAGFSAAFLALLDLETALAAGQSTFEEMTGRRMLATTQTREFDPPSNSWRDLDLKTDLLSVTGLTVGATALISGTDYRLLPYNAADDGRPYNMVRFNRWWTPPPTWAERGSVVITGSWGFGTTIPEAAWQGILTLAGLSLFPAIAQSRTRGIQMWREADVTEQYGADPLGSLRDNWSRYAMGVDGRGGVVGMYRRVTQG